MRAGAVGVLVLGLLLLSHTAWSLRVAADADADETEALDLDLNSNEEAELEAFEHEEQEQDVDAVEDQADEDQDTDEEVEADEEAETSDAEAELDEFEADAEEQEAGVSVSAVELNSGQGDQVGDSYAIFNKTLLDFLEKYKNAVEGGRDGKFKELFGDLKAIRKASPMFTTCTSFVPKVMQAAQRAANWRLPKDPSAIFFSRDSERKKRSVKASWFFAGLPPVANSWQKDKTMADWKAHDPTAVYVALDAPNAPRPKPGDVFLLGFAAKHPTSKLLTTGMFSHIGFVTHIEQHKDSKGKPTGIEAWTVVAGGGGNAKAQQEAVTESKMEVDTRGTANHPIMVGNPADPIKRYLAGWIPMQQLYKDGKAGFK